MHKFNLKLIIVNLLFASLTILGSAPYGYSADGSSQSESYLDRPHISTVKAQKHELGRNWRDMKTAHLSFVAFLLERYATEDLYFLARDSELLYDTAFLMTNENERARLHLLNVSRGNMKDSHLKDYLSQEGISEETLIQGKKIVFVDTGFAGTIPHNISQNFSAAAISHIKTHLIVSSNKDHPSSRTFLIHINPTANDVNPSSLHGTIINYEHMPRFTYRSDKFELRNKWIPVTVALTNDGTTNKSSALQYMEDIKGTASYDQVKKDFNYLRKYYREAITIFDSENISKEKKLDLLKSYAASQAGKSLILDLIDSTKNTNIETFLSRSDFGWAEPELKKSRPNKIELAKKFPQWKKFLEDPVTEVPLLFKNKDYQTLGSLLDVEDAEILMIIFKNIDALSDKKIKMSFLKKIIQVEDDYETIKILIKNMINNKANEVSDNKELLMDILEKHNGANDRAIFGTALFDEPNSVLYKELFPLFLENQKDLGLDAFALNIFKHPHSIAFKPYLSDLFKGATILGKPFITLGMYRAPHFVEFMDFLRYVIENGIVNESESIIDQVFAQDYIKNDKNYSVYLNALKIKSRTERIKFFDKNLNHPSCELIFAN